MHRVCLIGIQYGTIFMLCNENQIVGCRAYEEIHTDFDTEHRGNLAPHAFQLLPGRFDVTFIFISPHNDMLNHTCIIPDTPDY